LATYYWGDEKEMNHKDNSVYILASILSILYLLYGIIQFYEGTIAWWFPWIGGDEIQLGVKIGEAYIPNAFPDPFSGIILIIIGVIFARSIYLSKRNPGLADGFLFVGWILALLMLILNLVVLAADILDTYYPLIWGGKIDEPWTLGSDPWGISPHLILGIIATPIYWKIKPLLKQLIP